MIHHDTDGLEKMRARLQGNPEDDARRGHGHLTRKLPCPGCGEAATRPYRNTEYPCPFCRRLLIEAIDARLQKQDTDEQLVVVSERDWETRYMEGEYESYYEGNKTATPRHRLEVAMHSLIMQSSQKVTGENTNGVPYLLDRGGSYGSMSWQVVRKIRKVVARIISELDLASPSALSYPRGKVRTSSASLPPARCPSTI
jgi:hypothetical protein